MKHPARLRLALVLVLSTGACGGGGDDGDDDDTPPNDTGIADACNPLGGTACLYPWPSAAYLAPSADTATGFQVAIPIEAMPVNQDHIVVDPEPFNRYDGFSNNAPILAAFPGGVSGQGLPPFDDIGASLAADSPIVLLDMDTGERVPFFAEPDLNAARPELQALIIRPLDRMQPGHRHAVAIRKAVKAADGSALPIPAGFQALLDGSEFNHPLMAVLAPRHADILAALADAGVEASDLVLAWDFVTASDDYLTRDLLTMRDQALEVIGPTGAALTFDGEAWTQGFDPARVYRFIEGTYDTPTFLDDGESDLSAIARDGDDQPALQGTYRANFAALLPACVTTAELPLPVVVFGHGLFGNGADSLDSGLLQRFANDSCAVVVAGDFIGLTNRQFATAALSVNDLNLGPALIDKLGQSVINFIALERIVRGPFAASELFAYEGTPVIDPDRVYYYGASLGGIMGNVFMAYDPSVLRGVLAVPGSNWTLLMERCLAWPALQAAMKGAYPEPYDYQLNIALMGLAWDRFDPITTAARLLHDPLPGTPEKFILLQEARGDLLVTNIATEMTARVMGVPVISPVVGGVPFALPVTATPVDSALAIYDEEPQPQPNRSNVPPYEDNGTHGDVHEHPAVQRQVRAFLLEGEARNECAMDGQPSECNCAQGACE